MKGTHEELQENGGNEKNWPCGRLDRVQTVRFDIFYSAVAVMKEEYAVPYTFVIL